MDPLSNHANEHNVRQMSRVLHDLLRDSNSYLDSSPEGTPSDMARLSRTTSRTRQELDGAMNDHGHRGHRKTTSLGGSFPSSAATTLGLAGGGDSKGGETPDCQGNGPSIHPSVEGSSSSSPVAAPRPFRSGPSRRSRGSSVNVAIPSHLDPLQEDSSTMTGQSFTEEPESMPTSPVVMDWPGVFEPPESQTPLVHRRYRSHDYDSDQDVSPYDRTQTSTRKSSVQLHFGEAHSRRTSIGQSSSFMRRDSVSTLNSIPISRQRSRTATASKIPVPTRSRSRLQPVDIEEPSSTKDQTSYYPEESSGNHHRAELDRFTLPNNARAGPSCIEYEDADGHDEKQNVNDPLLNGKPSRQRRRTKSTSYSLSAISKPKSSSTRNKILVGFLIVLGLIIVGTFLVLSTIQRFLYIEDWAYLTENELGGWNEQTAGLIPQFQSEGDPIDKNGVSLAKPISFTDEEGTVWGPQNKGSGAYYMRNDWDGTVKETDYDRLYNVTNL